jgi:polyferredoxin
MKASRRHNARRLVGVFSVLAFPASFYYFSPYLSVLGASKGVVAGSALLFGLLFLSSLVVGRLFCSWACPAGALMDLVATARPKRFDRSKYHWIKYLLWAPWLFALLSLFVRHGAPMALEPGFETEYGLSATSAPALIMYLMIASAFFALSAVLGKRAGCHLVCWMAPFMVLGRAVSMSLRLPALRLHAERGSCTLCKACEKSCPMSIEISGLVQRQDADHMDCTLCGECVDSCPSGCLRFAWAPPQGGRGERQP